MPLTSSSVYDKVRGRCLLQSNHCKMQTLTHWLQLTKGRWGSQAIALAGRVRAAVVGGPSWHLARLREAQIAARAQQRGVTGTRNLLLASTTPPACMGSTTLVTTHEASQASSARRRRMWSDGSRGECEPATLYNSFFTISFFFSFSFNKCFPIVCVYGCRRILFKGWRKISA
jgi:hypothetical protein